MAGLVRELATSPRLGKFLSVGAVGAVIDLSISTVLTLSTLSVIEAIPPEGIKIIGAEAAIIVMFLINDRWTFPEHGMVGIRPKLRRFLTSNVVRSGGLAVQVAVVFLLTRRDVVITVAGTNVWDALTMPIAILAAFLVNYVAESLFTWRVTDGDDL